MKSVRFTEVVSKSGKPEVYLLLSKEDKTFHDALKHDRIMSLVGGTDGAKTPYGVVGYDEKRHGQLLLFPRSLKAFSDRQVVGIKFELLDEDKEPMSPAEKKPFKAVDTRKPKSTPTAGARPAKAQKETRTEKVIHFPKAEPAEEAEEELTLAEIRTMARQALRALEKNNSIAAYKFLKRMASE